MPDFLSVLVWNHLDWFPTLTKNLSLRENLPLRKWTDGQPFDTPKSIIRISFGQTFVVFNSLGKQILQEGES